MKIAIIGAGFTGLSAALRLSRLGQKVFLFEKESFPGGLAVGFKNANWAWPLEKHYHHLFVSDGSIRKLAKEVDHKIIFSRPKTSVYIDAEISQLDSPLSLLFFKNLKLLSRLRIGFVLLYLKLTPFWKPLEKITAQTFLKKASGESSWKVLWEPLFKAKFHTFAPKIPASWFWARIKKRSSSLGYPEKGFLGFAEKIEKQIKKFGGKFFYKAEVLEIYKEKGKFRLEVVKDGGGETAYFDKVIVTLPTALFIKVAPQLPRVYKEKFGSLEGLGALNLVLELSEKFLAEGTYWLNINQKDFPFLAIVEHTNFIDKTYYGGSHLVYIGNYLPQTHEFFSKTPRELLKIYHPHLSRIKNNYQSTINNVYIFKAPFAQPVIPLNYSQKMPQIITPIKGLYLANIEQVYPFDRGTNYAVELGEKAAKLVISTLEHKSTSTLVDE